MIPLPPPPPIFERAYHDYPHHLLGIMVACCKNDYNVHSLIQETNDVSEQDRPIIQYLKNVIQPERRNALMEDCRARPTSDAFRYLKDTDMEENENIIQYLLKHSRLDPSALDNVALMTAARANNHNIIKYLLQDPRVNPSDRENQAIKTAIRHGFVNVVHEFIMDERVELTTLNLDRLKKEAPMVDRYNEENVNRCIKLIQLAIEGQRTRIVSRCYIIKEGIVMKAWHPSRVEKLLEAGYDIEDM